MSMTERETIFALSSGRPPAAIAVIRISGPRAHDAALSLAKSLPKPRTATVRLLHDPVTGDLLDEVLILRFDAPASATGEDLVELHCHGGRAVVGAVLAALARVEGLRSAEPGEFTRRAYANGRIDLTEAEGLADLLESETEGQRRAALALADGGLRKQIAQWQDRILTIAAQLERAIDYDEEDEAGVDPAIREACRTLAAELDSWLERPLVEPLKEGIKVVAAGPPNAGKSSLINAIVGSERIIVSDQPGTTRDHIEIPLVIAGIPFVLTDTAGLRDAADVVEAIGVERARSLTESADILLWLGDPRKGPRHGRIIPIHSKADLPERSDVPRGSLAVSSTTGAGIEALLRVLTENARSLLPPEGEIALNRRQQWHLLRVLQAVAEVGDVDDVVIAAESIRTARSEFDQITGRAGFEEVMDILFARFCLGK